MAMASSPSHPAMMQPHPAPTTTPANKPTVRISVPLKESPGVVISYAEMYEHMAHKQAKDRISDQQAEEKNGPEATEEGEKGPEAFKSSSEDAFFERLLANAEHYAEEERDASVKRKRRVEADDEYDVNDPFIDDSDLLVEGFGYMRPKQDGFFVYKGPLETQPIDMSPRGRKTTSKRSRANNTTPQKDKRRKVVERSPAGSEDDVASSKKAAGATAAGAKKTTPGAGKPAAPKVKTTPAEKAATQAASATKKKGVNGTTEEGAAMTLTPGGETVNGGGPMEGVEAHLEGSAATAGGDGLDGHSAKKKKKRVLLPLSPDIQAQLELLRVEAAKESFANKAKFPKALRPIVLAAGRMVFDRAPDRKLDDNFISHLMEILPYNRFTLRKFVTKNVLPDIISGLERERTRIMAELRSHVEAAMEGQLKNYEEKMAAYDAEQAERRQQQQQQQQEQQGESEEAAVDPAEARKEYEEKLHKFRWNATMREMVFRIIQTDMEVVQLKNDLNEILGINDRLSEKIVRRDRYQELHAFWPPGWVTTYEISREYSLFKQRVARKISRQQPSPPNALPTPALSTGSVGTMGGADGLHPSPAHSKSVALGK
ncbi:uncharacterized protein VTP21DRAFT_6431 [Calcarisporiella thermophila]|uniref:uncharacterized protein n=1 Tax=Calcarisporiella thermophila TaxID=911321 RepID=UPI003741F420